jgi:signal transduction histidine kinase
LDAIQIKEAGASLEITECDVVELCEAAVQIIEPSVQKKGQKLLLQLPAKGIVVRMDPRRMRQVLVNLLSNALKFTSMDGEIGLAVRRVPGEVHFEVSDTGVGIPSEHLGRLFKPFVQLDETLSREQGGTGLGLALVDQLVKAHGGRVEVQSAVGKGSRFTVILPVAESTATA